MTIHLITVGDSARRSLTDPLREEPPPVELLSYPGNETRLHDAELLGAAPHDTDSVARVLGDLAADDQNAQQKAASLYQLADVPTWAPTASAELTSLHAKTSYTTVLDHDLVVLLATDTSHGLLAAWWNAAHMLRGDFTRLTYLDNPGEPLPIGPHGRHVVIVRLPGLDMRTPARHTHAMEGLGHVAGHTLDARTAGEDVAVHLSGGYKATMLFLLSIAEAMATVVASDTDDAVSAFVVHEDSIGEQAGDTRLVELPLRRFDLPSFRDELAAAERGQLPPGSQLRGYAYKLTPPQNPTRAELTPFGRGFLVLLQHSPGALG